MAERARIGRWAAPLFEIDPGSPLTLQDQIRRKIADAIARGALTPGQRLPSSRDLAGRLNVARNTVAFAYQQLIAEGLLVSRKRSGVFVSAEVRPPDLQARRVGGAANLESAYWRARLGPDEEHPSFLRPDWQRFPFPFVQGRFDRSLFPIAEWRDANRHALSVQDIQGWAHDPGDADDDMLIEEIRTKVLPRRGIHARPQEILITSGAQQAMHLMSELVLAPYDAAAVEDPGDPDVLALLRRRGARLVHQPVDDDGIIVDARLAQCRAVFVSPAHQRPTGAVLSPERRRDLLAFAETSNAIIVEDDFESETNYLSPALPALRAHENNERIAYAATLAQSLAPGLRLGVLVGDPHLIRAARTLRRITTRHPPLSLQRATAHLIALGQYDAIMLRTGRAIHERLMALRDALNHYLPQSIAIAPVRGGTSIWVRGPENLVAQDLVRAAEARGVLIEPVARYYANADAPKNVFRLGVSSIPLEHIRAGVAALAAAFREALQTSRGDKTRAPGETLDATALPRAMAGATFLYNTVYGEPCTIELSADGSMRGRAGFANEDIDEGRWWVEDDLWCRQWRTWAYGEVCRFHVAVEDAQIRWYSTDGDLKDSAVYLPS